MFYSHLLLSKKGALGTVWIAAHCHKRLKKDQVKQTDISSSVDKILVDEVPVVTYRILAYLLLGVVRIYSKKVEYLFHDCHEVLAKLHDFKIGKSSHVRFRFSQIPYHSITLPKRFELDAFDLELLEDQDPVGGNVNSHEEVMLADGRRRDESSHGLFSEENKLFSEAYPTACTPLRDVFSPHLVDHDSFASTSRNMNNSAASLEMLCGTVPSLEDHLDPMVLDEAEKLQLHDWLSNEDLRSNFEGPTHEIEYDTVASPSHKRNNSIENLEKLCGTSLSLEHCLNSMVLSEAEKNSHDKPSDKEHGVIEEVVDLRRTQPNFQEDELCKFTGLSNKEQPFDGNKMNSPEVIPTESRKCQLNLPVSITVDITPDSKLPEADVGTPEVATIKTPALKERAKIQKRRMLFDDTIAVPNKEFKSWIDDSSNLICKRRKVPHNLLHAWRASKLCQIPHSFLKPLISSISIDFNSLECKKKARTESIQIVNLPECGDVAKSPVTNSSQEQTPIAPATPLTHLNSLRSHETAAVANSEILEPATSLESMEKQPASSEGMDLEVLFRDELTCAYTEAISSEAESLEKNKFSARTRITGRYLYKNFLNKKRKKEDEVVKLSELLAGKAKKESARLFYEILVLKTVNCINVRQDNAYDDVLLQETSKLKQAFES